MDLRKQSRVVAPLKASPIESHDLSKVHWALPSRVRLRTGDYQTDSLVCTFSIAVCGTYVPNDWITVTCPFASVDSGDGGLIKEAGHAISTPIAGRMYTGVS